ncbi:hypothetical protein NP493_765g01014 [Ridgeia piscesae]|uniref:Uncharacterized protein n=1 Tax=Ridgeia piscesae TaxID=27915 RepID=A0AAD9NNI2_RIDPI|nr:hypothetical protein NP493_765g01014 [Ridgeia piscesae]
MGRPTPRGRSGTAAAAMKTDSVGLTEDVSGCLDYDTQLHKHTWKMEIPGDPLGLKSPCLPKRLPYTSKVRLSSKTAPFRCHNFTFLY